MGNAGSGAHVDVVGVVGARLGIQILRMEHKHSMKRK